MGCYRHRGTRISTRPQTPIAASTYALIDAFTTGSLLFPLPPTASPYDQVPLGHRTAMIRIRDDILKENMPPQRRFVYTSHPPGYDVADSFVVAARPPRGSQLEYQYVRWQESGDFYTQLHDAQTDHRDIRLKIDVVRGQRTAYETELHEVRQAYLCSKARNMVLLARLETLETYVSHMEWQRQTADDRAIAHRMRTRVLEARAQIDTVEDTCSSCHDAANAMTWGTLKKKLTDKYCPKGEIKKLKIELWILKVRGNDVTAYTQRFQELPLMCTKFLAGETKKINKYIGGLPNNIHGNIMSIKPKTLDDAIELANDLMDQKLRTYSKRQNDNKRKADDSSRNNQQQQPYKKQDVDRAYTTGPGEKKAYTRNLPLCTK
nr:reverse transcriptase domain-containing protein [Tanacetum cinerariifolium]